MSFSQDERREVLTELRKKLRITQLEMAKATGIPNSTLSLWESENFSLGEERVDLVEDFLTDELAKLKRIELDRGRMSCVIR